MKFSPLFGEGFQYRPLKTLNAWGIIKHIVPRIINNERHHSLDHHLIIHELVTELDEMVIVYQRLQPITTNG